MALFLLHATKRAFFFFIDNKKYYYYFNRYNTTYRNERCIEIALAIDVLRKFEGKLILEVGNVLSHYFQTNHIIVDKFEKRDNVVNEDILEFNTNKKFDLIISISTIEHIGWDETPIDSEKPLRVIEKLKKLLNPGGQIFITIPWGYNPSLDQLVKNNNLILDNAYYLRRIDRAKTPFFLKKIYSYNNEWEQIDLNSLDKLQYGTPYPNANGLIIGFINQSFEKIVE